MDPIQTAHQLTLQSAIKSTTSFVPIASVVAAATLSIFSFYSGHVTTAQKVEANASAIIEIRKEEASHQSQLDQEVAIQQELKSLEESNKATQQQVADLNRSFQDFESKFIVLPSTPPSPAPMYGRYR